LSINKDILNRRSGYINRKRTNKTGLLSKRIYISFISPFCPKLGPLTRPDYILLDKGIPTTITLNII